MGTIIYSTIKICQRHSHQFVYFFVGIAITDTMLHDVNVKIREITLLVAKSRNPGTQGGGDFTKAAWFDFISNLMKAFKR